MLLSVGSFFLREKVRMRGYDKAVMLF